ncbi:hypothetical protein MTQ10_12515 [Streptomyces sp. XM83C]|jgi:hypothetical protein|uniref:Immunity protein Imm1 n=1 Tax=Streptomyces thermocoprophilus TaxID=78356 RepID=A0ABV5VAH6_9ACTN|nr:hypothetical protein [Streptomyces sp. XM83C]MCK1820413.1 hypothetical protein [Streptomyces sp. XM83C]
MGYWGYFVVGRSERPLTETRALSAVAGELTPRASAPDGRQVWEYPSADGDVGSMNALARETGAPALFGYVMDGACVVVEAAAPDSGAWTACLARAATARYVGAGADGLTLEDYFLPPEEATARAVAWAAEAGRDANAADLLDVFSDDGTELAENLLFRLLGLLGVVPL